MFRREEMSQLFSASKNPANEIWEVSDALHSQGYKENPLQYIDRLDEFFSTRLKKDSTGDGETESFNSVGILSLK